MLRPEGTHWDQAADAAVADWAMSQRRHPELVPARLSCERLCVKMLACKLISSIKSYFVLIWTESLGQQWRCWRACVCVCVCVRGGGLPWKTIEAIALCWSWVMMSAVSQKAARDGKQVLPRRVEGGVPVNSGSLVVVLWGDHWSQTPASQCYRSGNYERRPVVHSCPRQGNTWEVQHFSCQEMPPIA